MGRKYPGSHMVHRTLPSFSAYDPVGQSVQMAAVPAQAAPEAC